MRDYSSAYRVSYKPPKISLGRGDVILDSSPFAYVIDADKRGQNCENCLSRVTSKSLIPCKKCGFPFYCSDGCLQQSYEEYHRFECENLKRHRAKRDEPVPNFARLLARIIFKLKDGGEKIEEKFCVNRGRKFKDLMNHYKDIKNDRERMKDVQSIMQILREFIGEENVPNESDFIGIYGRVLVNRFCLNDELNVPIGSAVFLAASIFDHSCMPNAHPTFIGKKLTVRTLVDIPVLNLDKVRICYIDCVNGTEMRRKELKKNWYFWCDCDLCNSEDRDYYENYMLCENPNCGEGILVPERYRKIDPIQGVRRRSDDDSTMALKNALQAAKVEYNFANVPVNPFASSDAMMSYLFYNKDRYRLAEDSDLTECTDDESAEENEETSTDQNATSKIAHTNGEMNEENSAISSTINFTETEQDQEISTSAADESRKKSSSKSVSRSDKKKASAKVKSNGLVNGALAAEKEISSNEKSTGDLDEEGKSKEKKVRQKPKSKSEDSVHSSEDKIHAHSNGKNTKITSEDLENSNGWKNDDEKHGSNGFLSNGHTTFAEDSPHTNGYFGEDEHDNSDKCAVKKKKMVRRQQAYEKSDVQCKGCQCYVDRNTLREYRSAIGFTTERLKDMKEESPNFQVVMDVLDRQGTLLPKLNVWRVRTLDYAFNSAFANGAWVLAMKYGLENLDGMKFLYGKIHPTLGLFFMKMGKVHMTLKLYREGLSFVAEAKEILIAAMGAKHPFVTGELQDLEMMANEDPEIMLEQRLAKMAKQVTEIVCPCCGKTKVIRNYGDPTATEKPWEQDRKVNKIMREDSMFFNSDFTAVNADDS